MYQMKALTTSILENANYWWLNNVTNGTKYLQLRNNPFQNSIVCLKNIYVKIRSTFNTVLENAPLCGHVIQTAQSLKEVL